jgi:predicted nucleic acid-binding protein
MMYLIDSSVFLEVLLIQEKSKICKDFLDSNIDKLHISDFSLHSIGVILFRNKKEEIFQRFVTDVIPNVIIITLPKLSYKNIAETRKSIGLDFDDTYQYMVAKDQDLDIVTLDSDFAKINNIINIRFL